MDTIIDDLVRAAKRCERAAKPFEDGPVPDLRDRILEACNSLAHSWSGSWLGYHANAYIHGLQPKKPGEYFHAEWGPSRSVGTWAEYTREAIKDEIFKRAKVGDQSILDDASDRAEEAFAAAQQAVVPILDAVLSQKEDPVIRDLRNKIAEMQSHFSRQEFVNLYAPKGQHATRDSLALSQGVQPPPHLIVQAWAMERASSGTQAAELGKLIRQIVAYLQAKMKMKGNTVAKTDGKVFIGHGGSAAWRDLKDFLQDRLKLEWEEFNRTPTAGKSTKERLEEMLDSACFAFLVMTAEDELVGGGTQARANVIHEVGLFQGRLGFEKAIVLLEEGCAEFGNIVGLTQIRFPKGNIKAKSEEIRQVLEREGIIKT